MSSIFAILFLVALAALIVGLRNPARVWQPSRKRVWIVYGGASLVLLAIFGMTSPQSAPTPAQTVAAPVATDQGASSTPPVPQTLEQKIAAYAPQMYGQGITLQGIDTDDTGSVLITLDVSSDSITSVSGFKDHTAALAARIFQDAFAKYPSAPEVSVIYAGAKTDMYGNNSNGSLMSYFITKPTFEKFNWQNFDTTSLCSVLTATQSQKIDDNSQFTDGCITFATNLR